MTCLIVACSSPLAHSHHQKLLPQIQMIFSKCAQIKRFIIKDSVGSSLCVLWHYVFLPRLAGKEKNPLQACTHAHTHACTTLIKCEDELDSGLVRGTLLMLIRGLGGYPSRWSRGGKSQCQGRTWQRYFVLRLNKVCSALYVKQKTRKNTAVQFIKENGVKRFLPGK